MLLLKYSLFFRWFYYRLICLLRRVFRGVCLDGYFDLYFYCLFLVGLEKLYEDL